MKLRAGSLKRLKNKDKRLATLIKREREREGLNRFRIERTNYN